MPAVRIFKNGDKLPGGRFPQARRFWLLESIRSDPINPPSIIAAVEIKEFFDVVRERPRVLDDFSIHINDVERAVRAVGELDRAKPCIGGADKLNPIFARATLGFEIHAIRNQDLAMNKI